MSQLSEKAVAIFNSGMNCSQSVFLTFCEKYGLSREEAAKISCGFGGGMRAGEVCGAVSGAVMVIGLKYGNSTPEDTQAKALCYSKTVEFINEFKAKTKTIICRELLGYDISTAEGMNMAKEKGLFKTTCVDMVKHSVEILEKLGY